MDYRLEEYCFASNAERKEACNLADSLSIDYHFSPHADDATFWLEGTNDRLEQFDEAWEKHLALELKEHLLKVGISSLLKHLSVQELESLAHGVAMEALRRDEAEDFGEPDEQTISVLVRE